MPSNKDARNLELEIELASLKSHEKHMSHIYGIRWAGLVIATITLLIGAAMIFMGLEGSFNWAVEAPNTVGAKLTNASPGIIFATVGLIIVFIVIIQKPVNYHTGGNGYGGGDISIGQSRIIGIGERPKNIFRDR